MKKTHTLPLFYDPISVARALAVSVCDARQVLHTAFVALQSVEPCMGPTRFVPGSATAAAHEALNAALLEESDSALDYCARARSVLALLGAGDAVCYDSRLHHCGGPNMADSDSPERVLFYLTFKHVRADDQAGWSNDAKCSLLDDDDDTLQRGPRTLGQFLQV